MTETKTWLSYSKKRAAVCSIGLLVSVVGCFPTIDQELHSSQSWNVGGTLVKEQIFCWEGFPDYTYLRVYTVTSNNRSVEIGKFENESSNGVTQPPEWIEGWLVVVSDSRVFLWNNEGQIRHISLFQVQGWPEFSANHKINGSYDYDVDQVQIENRIWKITYTRTSAMEEQPKQLVLQSTDGGKSFSFVD